MHKFTKLCQHLTPTLQDCNGIGASVWQSLKFVLPPRLQPLDDGLVVGRHGRYSAEQVVGRLNHAAPPVT